MTPKFNLEGERRLKVSGNSKDAMALDIATLMTWLHAACDEIERLRVVAESARVLYPPRQVIGDLHEPGQCARCDMRHALAALDKK